MKEVEKVANTPQTEKDAKHLERLYPTELDEAIVNENPLTYSRDKLTELLCIRLGATPEEIQEHLFIWVEKEFTLI